MTSRIALGVFSEANLEMKIHRIFFFLETLPGKMGMGVEKCTKKGKRYIELEEKNTVRRLLVKQCPKGL